MKEESETYHQITIIKKQLKVYGSNSKLTLCNEYKNVKIMIDKLAKTYTSPNHKIGSIRNKLEN